MKCNHCQAELPEGTSVCPNCGEVQQVMGAPKNDRSKLIILVLGIALLIALVALVVITLNKGADPLATEPSETLLPPASAPGDSTVTSATSGQLDMTAEDFLRYPQLGDRATYLTDAGAVKAAADTVVATAGEYALDVELLQVFYQMQINQFLQQAGAYAQYIYGIDLTQPLDQQTVSGTHVTWEQYFLDSALSQWYECALLNTMARENGFTLEAELVQLLDEMLVDLAEEAQEKGYADADALVASGIGPGCTAQGYYDYMLFYWTAMYYSMDLVESVQPTDEEIKAYFDAHVEEFTEAGITLESAPYVDVRHILIMPKSAAGTDTFTDEEWAAAEAEANALLEAWKAGEATEEAFAALANEHSEDPGSNTNGGIYENVTDDGTYVPEFTQWCINPENLVGSTGVVKTDYGYHVMYCSAKQEAWYITAQSELISQTCMEMLAVVEETCPMDFDRDALLLAAEPEETTPAE